MVRRLFLPLLGFAFFLAEAAPAQALPPASAANISPKKAARQQARATRRATHLLSARERRAAQAAPARPAAWGGWSDEPILAADPVTHRSYSGLSVAPGMPLTQIGHGLTSDCNGRPINRAASTTLR